MLISGDIHRNKKFYNFYKSQHFTEFREKLHYISPVSHNPPTKNHFWFLYLSRFNKTTSYKSSTIHIMFLIVLSKVIDMVK